MTDTSRDAFEALLNEPHPLDATLTRRDYVPKNDGGFIFLAFQAATQIATLAERERAANICMVLPNPDYSGYGNDGEDYADAIRSGK